MNKRWVLTQEAFDRLLSWLDPDRDAAGRKYVDIRRGLVELFNYRGCSGAEELADETINRVTKRVVDMAGDYVGDPMRYFYGVARKVYREYLREKPPLPIDSLAARPAEQADESERQHRCLEQCMGQLSDENREIITVYYSKDKREKINARKELGQRLHLTANALRVRAHRIRESLEKCLLGCLEPGEAARNGLK